MLWAFIGFAFADRYLKAEPYVSCIAGIIMIFLVIQIERQIILSSKSDRILHAFRLIIGISMALIGTVIIDQRIFKEDIEREKMLTMDEQVSAILPGRAEELKKQIDEITTIILSKENERKAITTDVSKNPFVMAYERQVQRDTSKNPITTTIRKQVPNPKVSMLEPLDRNILAIREEKIKKDSMLLDLRPNVEKELKANVGFLDELHVMYSLVSKSGLSFCAWFIWFVFLLGLELFILASKWGEKDTDYDHMMKQQMDLHLKRIDLMGKQANL